MKTVQRSVNFLARTEELSSGTGNAIKPGHLVLPSATGFVKHAVAGGTALKLLALENLIIGDGFDTAYADDTTVRAGYFESGAPITARVAASSPAIAKGDFLESAGDGTVRKVVTDAATDDTQRNSIVMIAEEAIDNSGGAEEVTIEARFV